MRSTEPATIVEGQGNVFADLGLPDPKELLLKAHLASKIYSAISYRGWTQTEAASALGLSQPDVSRLTNGLLKRFSEEKLMTLLVTLGFDVSIHIEGNGQPPEAFDFGAVQLAR